MRTKIIPFIPGYLFLLLMAAACDDSAYKEYTGNKPVYMTYEQLRSSVTQGNSYALQNPGKIYFKDNYIFIIEEQKGIHIYDNSSPSAPVEKDFITIPGVVDISVAGNNLYADSFVDLVVLDAGDISNVHETGRVKDILPYTLPPTNNKYPTAYIDKKKGVVKEWIVGIIKEKISNVSPGPYPMYFSSAAFFRSDGNAHGASSGVSGSGVGLGGSMARFGIKGDFLYTVTSDELKIFNISNKTNPVQVNTFHPGWGIETMFLTDSNMFLGSTTGMMIYDIKTPSLPVFRSSYNHIRACDPVIVDDTLAYVTLRSGNRCGGSTNVLDVINIRNIQSPAIVMTYPLVNPRGLGKDGNLLFICDGEAGLKVYDASDPRKISDHLLTTYGQIKTYDVIPVEGILFMIGDDGLYEYDYSSPLDIKLLSKISVTASAIKPD